LGNTDKKYSNDSTSSTSLGICSVFSFKDWKVGHTDTPEWFTAKGGISYEDDEQTFSGTLHLRIRKDSIIWASIQKLGFEGGRIQIDTGRFQLIQRLDGEAVVMPLQSLFRQWNLDFSFYDLQNILWYNVPQLPFCEVECSKPGNPLVINLMCNKQYQVIQEINESMTALKFFTIRSQQQHSELEMKGEDFRMVQGLKKQIPFQTHLVIRDGKHVPKKIDIEWESIEVNLPKKMSFSIPNDYPIKNSF